MLSPPPPLDLYIVKIENFTLVLMPFLNLTVILKEGESVKQKTNSNWCLTKQMTQPFFAMTTEIFSAGLRITWLI